MAIGPGTAYDLYLRNDPSGNTPEVGLVLDRDEDDRPRVREFRAPSVPPKQQSGPLSWSDKDALVDYVWAMDDWADGALRPYYRDGDRRYAQANGMDARGEGVLALGMFQSPQLSVLMANAGWESGDSGDWSFAVGGGGNTLAVSSNVARTGTYGLRISGSDAVSPKPIALFIVTATQLAAFDGETITFGAMVRSQSASPSSSELRFQIFDGVSTALSNADIAETAASSFTFHSVTHTFSSTPSNDVRIRITVVPASSDGATFDVDDMFVHIGANNTCVGVVEAAGNHYAAVGPNILFLDETDVNQPFWKHSYTEPNGVVATGIESFNDSVYVGYSTTAKYVSGTDGSWTVATTSDPRDKAQFFVVQGNRLWKNASSNSIEYAEANSGVVDSSNFNVIFNGVSDTGSPITGLYLLNNAVVLGTERGVAVFFEDEQRFRTIYAPFQTDPSSENFARGVTHHDGWLYLTTEKQGLVRFNGYSFEDLSELFMAPRLTDYGGRVQAISSDPYQLWLLVDTPTIDTSQTKTVRLMSLKQIGGRWKLHDQHQVAIGSINFLATAGDYLYGFGPAQHGGSANFMSALRFPLPIKVPFPFADEIGGRLLDNTGTIDMPRWHGGQPDAEKALISVDFWVEDTDSNNTIQLGFGVDGAANTTTTFTVVNSTTTSTPAIVTKTTASDLSSGTPSTVAVGRVFDFRFTLVRNTSQTEPDAVARTGGAQVSPKLYAFAAHFVLRPSRKRAWEIFVRLGGALLNGLRDDRGKSDVIADLDTLELQVFPIELEEDFDQNGVAVTRAVVIRDVERVLDEKLMGRSGRPLQEGEELWRLILQEV